jgi:hypothetical protein
MTSYIQNYGFTKTLFRDNKNSLHNEIKWQGDYDGKIANIDLNVNNNGNEELINIQLDNNDIKQLFGIQPVEVPLEQRLVRDFLYKTNRPITLEGALINRKRSRHTKKSKAKKSNTKKRKTRKLY